MSRPIAIVACPFCVWSGVELEKGPYSNKLCHTKTKSSHVK